MFTDGEASGTLPKIWYVCFPPVDKEAPDYLMEGDPGGKQAFRAATKRQSKMRSTRAYPRTYLDEL